MNFSQMSLDNGILHLANWLGNVIMPTIAAVFIIMAIVQFSKGQEFSHSMYGALACLMVSGLTRALETFASQRAWNNPDVYWVALITLINWVGNVILPVYAAAQVGLKKDWPRFTEEEPEIYENEELVKLFAVCDAEEKLWYEFFLMSGMREQEVMYTYWSDVNFAASTVKVTHKPDRGWTPKAYKEREIPIPTKLVNALKEWKAKSDKGCTLVFPTSGCNPKMNFLDDLKAVAVRAKMEPDTVWLHKFRATFATRCLWANVDLRTVQLWLGHTDIESTMRYLKPSRSEGTNQKVNAIFG